MDKQPITGNMVVLALREIRRSVPVQSIAQQLGTSDTRAIATAARKPGRDGRIAIRYNKGRAWYRFVRLSPRATQRSLAMDKPIPEAVLDARQIIDEFVQCAAVGRPYGKLIAQARDWLALTAAQQQECTHRTRCDCLASCKYGYASDGATQHQEPTT